MKKLCQRETRFLPIGGILLWVRHGPDVCSPEMLLPPFFSQSASDFSANCLVVVVVVATTDAEIRRLCSCRHKGPFVCFSRLLLFSVADQTGGVSTVTCHTSCLCFECCVHLLTMLFTEARKLAFLLRLVLKILIWPSSPTSPAFQS